MLLFKVLCSESKCVSRLSLPISFAGGDALQHAFCARSSDGHDDGSDHAEETKHFREDENQDEGHKYLLVDRIELDSLFTYDADSVPGCDIAQARKRACEKVQQWESCSLVALGNYLLGEEYRDDETVDGENTSHNDWDD